MTRSGHPEYVKVRNFFVKAYARKGDFESKLPIFTHTVLTSCVCTLYCAALSLCGSSPCAFSILPSNSLSLFLSITAMNHTHPIITSISSFSVCIPLPTLPQILLFSFSSLSLLFFFLDCLFQFLSFVWHSCRG